MSGSQLKFTDMKRSLGHVKMTTVLKLKQPIPIGYKKNTSWLKLYVKCNVSQKKGEKEKGDVLFLGT